LRITAAGERGGVDKIIACIWENLDVSIPNLSCLPIHYLQCEHTIWRGARAIRDLFIQNESVKQHCIDVKCEEILIAGLTAFPSSTLVQAQCLRVLAALVFGSDIVSQFDFFL
jgi:hypothetical protein